MRSSRSSCRPVEDAAVVAVRGVRLARGGGRPAGGAVGHHLERAELQPLVAETGADAGAQQPHERVLATVHRREGVDPQAQAAGVGQRLGRSERRAHQSAGVVHAGAAGLDIRRVGAQQRVAELLGARHRGHLQRRLRGLVGDAEVPPAVAVVASAGGVGRGVVDPRGGQGPSVDGGDVPAGPREDHRMVGRHRIPVQAIRVTLLLQARLVVPAPADPRARRLAGRALLAPRPAARRSTACPAPCSRSRPPPSRDRSDGSARPRTRAGASALAAPPPGPRARPAPGSRRRRRRRGYARCPRPAPARCRWWH